MTMAWMAVFSALVWWAYRTIADDRHPAIPAPSPDEGALSLARRRFLHGEITAEDYRRIANVLRS